jgi:hypothetical protein
VKIQFNIKTHGTSKMLRAHHTFSRQPYGRKFPGVAVLVPILSKRTECSNFKTMIYQTMLLSHEDITSKIF